MTRQDGRRSLRSVLLLGWGAAKPRHLQPYEAWYRARSHAVASHVMDPGVLRGGRWMARDLDRLLERVHDLGGPCLVHSFSRTGFITYASLLASEIGDELRRRVVGHVFDSAPGLPVRMTATAYAQGLTEGIEAAVRSRFPHPVPGLARIARAFAMMSFRAHFHLVPRVSSHYALARARYADLAPVVPLLCLCSRADRIVDYASVQEFIACERARGVHVHCETFAESRHVQHFRRHPRQYGDALQTFVTRVSHERL